MLAASELTLTGLASWRTADAGDIRFHVAVSVFGGTFQFEGCLGIKSSEVVMALADIISSEGV